MTIVVPAKAGTQGLRRAVALDPGFRRGDEEMFFLRVSVVKMMMKDSR